MIYFLQAKDGGPIKIGSSKAPDNRASSLGLFFPYGVEHLAMFEGGRVGEAFLHLCFRPLGLSAEWFRSGPAVWRLILDVIDNGRPAFLPEERLIRQEELEQLAVDNFGSVKASLQPLGYRGNFKSNFQTTSGSAYAVHSRMAFALALRDGTLPRYIADLHGDYPASIQMAA